MIETGQPVAAVAAELGAGDRCLVGGAPEKTTETALMAGDTGAVLDAEDCAKLQRLRRENAELRLDPLPIR